jgi:hypothetical protein
MGQDWTKLTEYSRKHLRLYRQDDHIRPGDRLAVGETNPNAELTLQAIAAFNNRISRPYRVSKTHMSREKTADHGLSHLTTTNERDLARDRWLSHAVLQK